MRLASILAAVVLAGVLAASRKRRRTSGDGRTTARCSRGPRPMRRQIAEQVARRLTGHNTSVRCGPLGMSNPHILGVTMLLHNHSFDYFLMRPAECTYLAWFHQSPAALGSTHVLSDADCAAGGRHRDGARHRRARVVPHARLLERGAGRVLRHAVDLVRREQARRVGRGGAGDCAPCTRRRCTRRDARGRRRTGRRSARTAASSTCATLARWPLGPS